MFQSWVPFGTTLRAYSAAKMASAHEAAVRFIVVINRDPPGYEKHFNYKIKINMARSNTLSKLVQV